MGNIFIGTAGWSYKDWYGIVYPPKPAKGFKELDYLATLFNTVEVNSSFYRPPNPFMSSAWVQKTLHNPAFLFTAKLWQRFTHQRQPYSIEEVKTFTDGIDPLVQPEKLGALLIQFPWSFKNDEDGRKWLTGLFDTFRNYPLVVELRHAGWDNPTVYEWLDKRNVSIASIDQPVIGKSIEFKPVITGKIGYVRMHGRNYKAWFAKKDEPADKKSPAARYDYLYTKKEIGQITDTVKDVSEKAEKTFVIQNNHPWGQAVANAVELKASLDQDIPELPDTLLQRFPHLYPLSEK